MVIDWANFQPGSPTPTAIIWRAAMQNPDFKIHMDKY
jgi:hypothetical protein